MTPPVSEWLTAFLFTLVLEAPIYVLFLRRRCGGVVAPLAITLFVNCATHPALWYLFPRFEPYALWLVIAELWVAVTEGILIAAALRFRPTVSRALKTGLIASFVANLFSTTVGLLARAI